MTTELENSFKGPGFGVTFLYYFALGTMVGAIAAMEFKHLGPTAALPYQYGILFGFPFALLNAWTKRSKTLSVSVKTPKAFQKDLNASLSELDFLPSSEPETEDGVIYLEYKKEGFAGFLAGKIYVAIAAKEAIIASRAATIKQLETEL